MCIGARGCSRKRCIDAICLVSGTRYLVVVYGRLCSRLLKMVFVIDIVQFWPAVLMMLSFPTALFCFFNTISCRIVSGFPGIGAGVCVCGSVSRATSAEPAVGWVCPGARRGWCVRPFLAGLFFWWLKGGIHQCVRLQRVGLCNKNQNPQWAPKPCIPLCPYVC